MAVLIRYLVIIEVQVFLSYGFLLLVFSYLVFAYLVNNKEVLSLGTRFRFYYVFVSNELSQVSTLALMSKT